MLALCVRLLFGFVVCVALTPNSCVAGHNALSLAHSVTRFIRCMLALANVCVRVWYLSLRFYDYDYTLCLWAAS